ncbi:Juxtaposed with another zinc finger protein 1 [Dermatophagoides pteronyssinus]|uniref:Juxtaposed with another zinc finger protein 1 n=1 Tax=Dermatophagoides pteronyssinus TaxID=6956 RepID=A0ABQ8IYQ3_DERPT|nr:Juxtaposed with another zinc finger protein 1 [Dermatophagoides pteronyssinus]
MAVFLSNVCTFNSCGIKFASLTELIRHIEDHHLDVDAIDNTPQKNPSNTNCMPVSCVLRIFSNDGNDLNNGGGMIDSNSLNDSHNNQNNNYHNGHHGHHHHVRKSINSPAASLSTTPTEGSELDDDAGFESDSGQSSIDSWANVDTTNTNALTKFHQIMGSNVSSSPTIEQTTNVNGLQNVCTTMNGNGQMITNSSKMMINNGGGGGGKNIDEKRLYHCTWQGCNKQYRTSNSLSHHKRTAHINKDNKMSMAGNNNNGCGNQNNNGQSNGHPMTPKTPTIKPMLDENNRKIYRCICGKIYKTSHGLKSHQNTHHSGGVQHQYAQNNHYQQQQQHDNEMMTSIIHQKSETFNDMNSTTSSSSSSSNSNYIHVSASSMTNTNGNNNLQLSSIKAELLSPTTTTMTSNNNLSLSRQSNNRMINIGHTSSSSSLQTNHNTTTVHFNQNDLIPDQSCPPVSVNVEVTSCEPKQMNFLAKNSSPPIISAPTLQQHLLSPVIPK